MGTGIVATAAVTLPAGRLLRPFATVVWLLAAVLLAALGVAAVRQWRRHPLVARGHAADPVMAHFYGAPPMALLTVGAGTLLLGPDLIGERAAVAVDWVLWSAGTALGLVVAVAIPFLRFTRERAGDDSDAPFGGWLMPVVTPMVSAATGALLVPHAPAGQARLTLLLGCYAMFGLSLIAAFVTITIIWQRLAAHPAGPARMVPTLWILLGPLGQGITAANLLGGVAGPALPEPYAQGFRVLGVVLGVPVWGFAVLWGCLAVAITVRTARRGLPFSLTWWSFTFPVGTCVTGTSALAAQTGAALFQVAAVMLYMGLAVASLTVTVRTIRWLREVDVLSFGGRRVRTGAPATAA